jgi:hypothetical protein
MTFQRQEAPSEIAELAWHRYRLIEAPLTNQEREYHRDMISWLERHRASGKSSLICAGNPESDPMTGVGAA